MTFKKYLGIRQNNKAQATLEYFIILAIIALLTILSLTSFHNQVISNTQNDFFRAMIGKNGLNVNND